MIKPAISVFQFSLYTYGYFFNLLTPTLALPTSSDGGIGSGSVSNNRKQRSEFSSEILINGEDRNNGTVVSMEITSHAFSFASLPPVEESPNIDPYYYWTEDTLDESQVTPSSSSSLAGTDGEEGVGENEGKEKDEEGMLVKSAEILSAPARTRCFLLFPYEPLSASSSAPRSMSEVDLSSEVGAELELEPDSEDTHVYRFTSPMFTSDTPLIYNQSPVLSPSSPPAARQPLSDVTSDPASALICYLHPYPSPSSYPFNYPTRPAIMPVVILLLEYINQDVGDVFQTQSLGQDQDADSQLERTGGLEILTLDLYRSGSARYAFPENISRRLNKVRGIRRAVVLEQGESAAEYQGKKVVCRFEKGDAAKENSSKGMLWSDVDAEEGNEKGEDDEDDGWDSFSNTPKTEWEWDVEEDAQEESEDDLLLPSFSLDEAIQAPVHGVRAVVCAYE